MPVLGRDKAECWENTGYLGICAIIASFGIPALSDLIGRRLLLAPGLREPASQVLARAQR